MSAFRPACLANRPASHRATRKATATSRPYVWRNEKWKISGYIDCLPLGPQHIDHQQAAGNHNGRIRHVERGPMIFAGVQLQKIRHPAAHDAVEYVACR